MQMSDAIATGRMVVEPVRGYILRPGMKGCALGMAGVAQGLKLAVYDGDGQAPFRNYALIAEQWPWLRDPLRYCPVPGCFGRVDNYRDAIIHIFDQHVANDPDSPFFKPQTLDQ